MVQVDSEVPRPIQEFNVQNKPGFEADLVDRLREPTRTIADLHLLVGPGLWYGSVFPGRFDNKNDLERFKRQLQQQAQLNPAIADPYTKIGFRWDAVPIRSITAVQELTSRVADQLQEPINYIDANGQDADDEAFMKYLEAQAGAFRDGDFDRLMINWLRRPVTYPVGWFGGPVEYYHDPLKKKAAFQGMLTTTALIVTKAANAEIDRFKEASKRVYGQEPINAVVEVAYTNILSGWLGERGRIINAENIPNDPDQAKRAGNQRIELFMGRIMDKNDRILSPAAQQHLGFKTKFYDIVTYVDGHEFAHGYRWDNEAEHWGSLLSVGRELLAADRAVVLASQEPFREKALRRVCLGMLAYALDDSGKYVETALSEPGTKMPSLEMLRGSEAGDYTPGGFLILRAAYLNGYLRNGRIDLKGIVRLAAERDKELERIAKGGTEEEAVRFFRENIEMKKSYPLNGGYSIKNDEGSISSLSA